MTATFAAQLRNKVWAPILGVSPIRIPKTPPVGSFTAAANGLTVSLDASTSSDQDGTIASYAWKFSDGGVATGRITSHTFAGGGPVVAELTVTDNDGLTSIPVTRTLTLTAPVVAASGDWSDSNVPWAVNASNLTDGWPADAVSMIANYTPVSGKSFADSLDTMLNSRGKATIVRLPAGVFRLTNFAHPQTAANYGLGYYHPNLHGFIGAGVEQTVIEMAANSYTAAQLSTVAGLTSSATSAPIGFQMLRFGSGDTGWGAVYNAGLTFRGADQQQISSYAAGVGSQPAPYRGVNFYSVNGGITQNVRFQGCAHAATSMPPFECGAVESLRSTHTMRRTEIDGRLAAALDPNRARRSNVWMGNNETGWTFEDVWMHHTYRSRYAVNDGNRATFGTYKQTRVKIDHIAEIDDGKGGTTSAACAGYENSAAAITWDSPVLEMSSTNWNATHLSLTTVPGQAVVNPAGGRLTVTGGTFRSVIPQLNGFLVIRALAASRWTTDGLGNTITVKSAAGVRKLPSSWTSLPSAAQLAAAGVTPATHYIVKAN